MSFIRHLADYGKSSLIERIFGRRTLTQVCKDVKISQRHSFFRISEPIKETDNVYLFIEYKHMTCVSDIRCSLLNEFQSGDNIQSIYKDDITVMRFIVPEIYNWEFHSECTTAPVGVEPQFTYALTQLTV